MMFLKPRLDDGFFKAACLFFRCFLLSVAIGSTASAHLMVAQNGTVNIVGDGAFLVLSLPVSAFENVDDDGDKLLSRAEFTKHRATLMATINDKVKLLEKDDARPLQGMMLSPVAPHNNPMAATDQLIIMGRFLLANTESDFSFHLDLFGTEETEKQQKMTFTFKEKSLKNKVTFTPKKTQAALFPKEDSSQ